MTVQLLANDGEVLLLDGELLVADGSFVFTFWLSTRFSTGLSTSRLLFSSSGFFLSLDSQYVVEHVVF